MSNTAICIIALFCLIGWWELVDAVKAIVSARSGTPRCPCRDRPAFEFSIDFPSKAEPLKPGEVVPLQPGELASAEAAARKVH